MEKKTIIAVVLAVGVIIVGMLIQSVFFPRPTEGPQPAQTAAEQPQAVQEPAAPQAEQARPESRAGEEPAGQPRAGQAFAVEPTAQVARGDGVAGGERHHRDGGLSSPVSPIGAAS